MAQVNNNPILKGASGMLGRVFYYRTTNGKTQMVNRPSKRKKNSKKQQAGIDRFHRAVKYATRAIKNPDVKLLYSTGITPKKMSAYHVALADSMNTPIVEYIKATDYTGAIGDTITIKATDDFKVVRVKVKITNNGKIIENGDAVRVLRKPNIWKFKTSIVNPTVIGTAIKVTAFDIPNNEGLGEIVL